MNARQHELRLTVELRQVSEAVQCIFHSVLLHRTLPKFQYREEKNFSLGSIGIKEVNCENIDLTYVRINSSELAMCVDEDVRQFRNEVEEASNSGSTPRRTPLVGSPTDTAVPLLSAQIGLDFYKRQRRQSVGGTFGSWLAGSSEDMSSWEQWKLILDIFKVDSFDELQKMKMTVSNAIGDMVLDLCESINNPPTYTPKMPSRSELCDVFDTRFSDCQPYLFKIRRQAVPTIALKPSFTQATIQRWKDVLF